MLNLNLKNIKVKSFSPLKSKLEKIKKQQLPVFETYKENIPKLKKNLKKYSKYKNIIVISNGGSRSSFIAYYSSLIPLKYKKTAFALSTMEPDLINDLKKSFPKKNTLIIPISKSGTTVGVLESLFAFKGYKTLTVTTPNIGALAAISEKENFEVIPHPSVGGRYTGLSTCAYTPSILFDIKVEEIEKGAREIYKKCNPKIPITKNPALKLAASLYLLEKKGYSEIFAPIYSSKLSGFGNIIVQLMHESVCKQGKGQTIYCPDAPESQHHTNQRFFGGKKNAIGLFIKVDKQHDRQTKVNVPKFIKNIQIKNGHLSDIDKVHYESALEYEFKGTYQDAVNNKLPCAILSIDKITPKSIGEFIGFWHYVAVYSSWLRNVNPFDQPQVENSKNISFNLRKKHKK